MSEHNEELWLQVKAAAQRIFAADDNLGDEVEELRELYFQLQCPEELAAWGYLHDGHSEEYYDRSWIPGVTTYNHEKWLKTVKEEARRLLDE
jgi:hypothetical protein